LAVGLLAWPQTSAECAAVASAAIWLQIGSKISVSPRPGMISQSESDCF